MDTSLSVRIIADRDDMLRVRRPAVMRIALQA